MNDKRLHFLLFWLLLGLPGLFSEARAQDPVPPDTSLYRPMKDKPIPLVEEEGFPDEVEPIATVSPLVPAKAAFYSAVLPGMGQAYNNAHWKIPIIYGGGAFIAWRISSFHKLYSANLRNLQTIELNPDISTIAFRGDDRDRAYFLRQKDRYRRERDYMIIMGGILYGMNIVEAYVDAHLQDFDLNDDLSMRLKPTLLAGAGGPAGAGLALTFYIK